MKCKNCGAEIPDNSVFCTNCGAFIQREQEHQEFFDDRVQQPNASAANHSIAQETTKESGPQTKQHRGPRTEFDTDAFQGSQSSTQNSHTEWYTGSQTEFNSGTPVPPGPVPPQPSGQPQPPQNNQPQKKAYYKKTWFKVLAIILIVVFGFAAGTGSDSAAEDYNDEYSDEDSSYDDENIDDISSISAVYNGSRKAGTVINNKSDIIVTAHYNDGSVASVKGWKVRKKQKLEKGKTSYVIIEYANQTTTLSIKCSDSNTSSSSNDAAKDAYATVNYDDLINDESGHMSDKITFRGQIVTCEDSDDGINMIIATQQDSSGNWNQHLIYCYYAYDDDDSHFAQGDIITIYGTYYGNETATSDDGQSLTVPTILCRIVEKS
jgi:hypothetical protein